MPVELVLLLGEIAVLVLALGAEAVEEAVDESVKADRKCWQPASAAEATTAMRASETFFMCLPSSWGQTMPSALRSRTTPGM